MFFFGIWTFAWQNVTKSWKSIQNGYEMGPGRSLELRKEKRANASKPLWPPGPQFGPFWGEPWDTKAGPGKPLGRQRGSKTPSREVKSRSGKLQNDICMRISWPSWNFHVFFNFGASKLQRNRWNNYRKNTLKKNRRLCLHRSADMHNVS